MIDAYTIGITLALENGVSDGIAAIRRDLAALDRAVEASSAGLLQLQANAGVALAAASADLSRLLETARRTAASLPRPSAETALSQPTETASRREPPSLPADDRTAPVPPAASPSPAERAGPTSATAPVAQPLPVPAAGVSAAIPTPTIAPVVPPATRDRESEQGEQRTVHPATSLPDTAVIPKPSATLAIPAASPRKLEPSPSQPRDTVQPRDTAAAVPAIDYAAVARAIAPKAGNDVTQFVATRHIERTQTETRILTREREFSALPVPSAAALPEPASGAPASVRLSPAPAPRSNDAASIVPEISKQPASLPAPTAPTARQSLSRADGRETALPRAVASGLPSAARRQSAATSQPRAVEVVLDGAAIGRWMDQRLARAATRPPSGTTGFDPRLSPIWTTAPVAN